MISSTNKTIAFFLGLILSIISWVILFANIILKIGSLTQIGIYSIDTFGFAFTTIILTMYTFYIIFKLSSISYFPILLILLHISSLNGSTLAIFFVIVDLLILLCMNTGSSNKPDNTKTTYTKTTASNHRVSSEDIFDAEYNTKEE